MNILPISDLHIEFHKDGGKALLDDLPAGDYTSIIAGDLCNFSQIKVMEKFLIGLAEKCNSILYVAGNHEFSHIDLKLGHGGGRALQEMIPSLTYLNNEETTIDGHHFYGGTMWYDSANWDMETYSVFYKFMFDPKFIEESGHHSIDMEIAYEFYKFRDNFKACVTEETVVISHHLPHKESISPFFKGSPLNPFFYEPGATPLLESKSPKLWIHGHTHSPVDTVVGETRIYCNPFGYPSWLNKKFSLNFIEI